MSKKTIYTLQSEFDNYAITNPSWEEIESVIEAVGQASLPIGQKRVSGSRSFHQNTRAKNAKQNTSRDCIYKFFDNNPEAKDARVDIVALKGDYSQLITRLTESGFGATDTSGEGVIHRLRGDKVISGETFRDWGFEVELVRKIKTSKEGT